MRSRIRRRARALREPFGTAGLLVAIVALVFAMSGGAFAAKYLITSTKQIKPSVLKSLKGKEGPRGLAGTNGTNGANGKDGARYPRYPRQRRLQRIANTIPWRPKAPTAPKAGSKLDGTATTYACNGKRHQRQKRCQLRIQPSPMAAAAKNGGTKVEVEGNAASKNYVCNGRRLALGRWRHAARRKTETGTWSVLIGTTGNGLGDVSFPIPLGAEIPPANVRKVLAGGSVPAECNDGAGSPPSVANPEADPGYLCVFVKGFLAGGSVKYIWNPETTSASTDTGAGTTGALLIGTSSSEDAGTGTFAVTAP